MPYLNYFTFIFNGIMVPNNLQKNIHRNHLPVVCYFHYLYRFPHEKQLAGETDTEDCKIPSSVENNHDRQGQVI